MMSECAQCGKEATREFHKHVVLCSEACRSERKKKQNAKAWDKHKAQKKERPPTPEQKRRANERRRSAGHNEKRRKASDREKERERNKRRKPWRKQYNKANPSKPKPKAQSAVRFPICRVCERVFCSRTRATKVCSDECKKEENRRVSLLYYKTKTAHVRVKTCVVCGCEFVRGYGLAGLRDTCSERCKDRQSREVYKANKATRRARKKNAFVSPVSPAYIYRRDKGKCHLCGGRVDRRCKVPHARAPVMDHIIPLAKGGTHEPKNVRLAHFLCNSKKSDGTVDRGEQLMLFG